MKEHKDAFDDWLKSQEDHAPVPNPDAFWNNTAAKLPVRKSMWMKWFFPLLILMGGIGGVLLYISNNEEVTSSQTIEAKEVSNDIYKEGQADISQNNVEIENAEENETIKIAAESDVNVVDNPVDPDETTKVIEPTEANASALPIAAQNPNDQIQTVSSPKLPKKSNTLVSGQAKIPDDNKSHVVDDLRGEYDVANSKDIAALERMAENKSESSKQFKNVDDPELLSDKTNAKEENPSEEFSGNQESGNLQPSETDVNDEKEKSVEEEVVEVNNILQDESEEEVEEEEGEKSNSQLLKKISDQPKWTAFTAISGGIFPFSEELLPVAGIEVGAEYAFSPSWGISGAGLFTGLSNLNTTTTFTHISYDFFKREETATLTYSQAFYVQVPIRVHYRHNRHMFSVGMVPGFVINGRASLRGFGEESGSASVWGYTDGIRTWNVSGAIEYDYAISKNWQIGLLFHGSPQPIMLDDVTLGGFQYIQLRIRKWW
ncbi:MAG: hypothetical protein JJU02_05980 [Cryomorphaceae bacterium]|nr:hypothetical protein [Cryomorphaceae bacterium]